MAAGTRRDRVVPGYREAHTLIGDRLEQVIQLLDDLERSEAALLCWGVTSGGFSEVELRDRVAAVCDNADEVENLIEDLEFAGLLVRSRVGGDLLWRTRSAETVRLLGHLRQLFPKHRKRTEGWACSRGARSRLPLCDTVPYIPEATPRT